MGVNTSKLSHRSGKLKFQSDDWPYVAAIRDAEVLDWRRTVQAETSEGREAEIRRIRLQQADLPVEISEGLFLSNATGATRLNRLNELGVTHVMNVAGRVGSLIPDEAYRDAGIRLLIVDAEDEVDYPMLDKHFEDAKSFVNEARDGGGACLVHCQAGINRSGVLVAAYKMVSERMEVLDVVLHCRRQRGNLFLSTNQGFQEQLVALARREGLLGTAPALQSRERPKDVLLYSQDG